ncbi:MAG: sugar phosphate isomerase/epimerase [Limnochordaceae bacterium]|nr:sugar phosphate isomerase/epimerase [Limnochordaceae bacterium]
MYYPRPLVEIVRHVLSTGLRRVELTPQDWTECGVELLEQVPSLRGLEVGSIHFPHILGSYVINPYPVARQTAKLLFQRLTELASRVGATTLVVHPPPNPKGHNRLFYETSVENLRLFGDLAAKLGVRVAVENSPGSVGRTAEGLLQFVAEVAHPAVVPMLDPTETIEAGQDPYQFAARLAGIHHLHLSDATSLEKHLPLGDGEVDWPRLLSALAPPPSGEVNCVVELHWKYLLPDAEAPVTRSLSVLQAAIRRVVEGRPEWRQT